MEALSHPISLPNICEWCGGVGTSRCARCHTAYYCSRDHQIQHWPAHKKVCKKSPAISVAMNVNQPTASNMAFSSVSWNQSNTPSSINHENTQLAVSSNMHNPHTQNITSEKPMNFNITSENQNIDSLRNEIVDVDIWGLMDAENISDFDLRDVINQLMVQQDQPSKPVASSSDTNVEFNIVDYASLNDICKNIIHDLDECGVCVLDKFVGVKAGTLILEEVKNLYENIMFEKGEVVTPYPSEGIIRNDVITWVNGTEPYCQHIGDLIQKLDRIIVTCNRMQNNGSLSNYKIYKRTKAMVACYPGNGTYYKKHVDNPHKDGRCITCIYYLNKDWDVQRDGGLLQMCPAARNKDVAQIAPVFDRMIFFWSDRRSPHEVLPAYATRFAITVWYLDADEREAALKREVALKLSKRRSLQAQMQSFK